MTKRSQARGKRRGTRTRSPAPSRRARWLLPLGLGLGLGVVAAWLLLSSSPLGSRSDSGVSSEPPHAEIGEASRARLDEILREADRDEESARARAGSEPR